VFLTFENDGLETTSLETQTIVLIEGAKVFKNQKVVEDEVNKMKALGVGIVQT